MSDFLSRFISPALIEEILPYVSNVDEKYNIYDTILDIKKKYEFNEIYQKNCSWLFISEVVCDAKYNSRNIFEIDGRGDGLCFFNSLYIFLKMTQKDVFSFDSFINTIKGKSKETIRDEFKDFPEFAESEFRSIDSDVPCVELFANEFSKKFKCRVMIVNMHTPSITKNIFDCDGYTDSIILFNSNSAHFSLLFPMSSLNTPSVRNELYDSIKFLDHFH